MKCSIFFEILKEKHLLSLYSLRNVILSPLSLFVITILSVRRNLMRHKILYKQSQPSVTCMCRLFHHPQKSRGKFPRVNRSEWNIFLSLIFEMSLNLNFSTYVLPIFIKKCWDFSFFILKYHLHNLNICHGQLDFEFEDSRFSIKLLP